ncbi:uncharacterized protein K489DRAFT_12589 [Dissoconium aciculare CBS 342.82]|uniref:Uncharacterized protein n=1 Tax=Dissoconium aciculare CBS 342.82 TaxID=1314786 RepID=A0A6J3MH79_9PEZI|nr:uncharacterized protein K489DRAFT_12589 [Dissoconium aciculare CBS 342.82]KAF1827306.1 hypothetical protein K489DRAFT_12589 [Dissoconium aciculare CBS 342.82]
MHQHAQIKICLLAVLDPDYPARHLLKASSASIMSHGDSVLRHSLLVNIGIIVIVLIRFVTCFVAFSEFHSVPIDAVPSALVNPLLERV